MHSKNKPRQTAAESAHVARVAALSCGVCDAPGPSEVHEPEQGMWWISVPLCRACHQGPQGWHGTRDRWKLRLKTLLGVINDTIRRLACHR